MAIILKGADRTVRAVERGGGRVAVEVRRLRGQQPPATQRGRPGAQGRLPSTAGSLRGLQNLQTTQPSHCCDR